MISVFFDVEDASATENPFLASLFSAVETQGTAEASSVSVRQFLGTVDMEDYWAYSGSFTAPPCTEGIMWNVIKQVQSISPAQLEKLTSKLAGD